MVLRGCISSVMYPDAGNNPQFEAILDDGSGAARIVWMGVRNIAGIQQGSKISVDGFVSVKNNALVMFNPAYRLLPQKEEV